MSGHQHLGGPHMTQNQGNVLGDRPCVRQSMLYRQHVGGNEMKGILGQDSLQWDTTRTQGAYEGGRVYDHNTQSYQQQPAQQPQAAPQQDQPTGHRRGAGNANRSTYNILTGQ